MKTISVLTAGMLLAFSVSSAEPAKTGSAENSASEPSIPPFAAFSPLEMLAAKNLPFTGGFNWEAAAKADPEVKLDYMPVDGRLWAVVRKGGTYFTITRQDELQAVVKALRIKARSPMQVVPYSGKFSWKNSEAPQPVKFMGEYINLLATNINGTWYVLDNRPLPGSIMGAMTVVTNDFQLLLIADETIKDAVRQSRGEVKLGPPPGEEDPPKKQKTPPLGV